ncbi:hypothetical protein GCM10029992_49530 [Glycomyces albus]
MLKTGEWQRRARDLGKHLESALSALPGDRVADVRVRGLWAGVDLAEGGPSAREVCERMAALGVLCKEAHGKTIRMSPPLVIESAEIDQGVAALRTALEG